MPSTARPSCRGTQASSTFVDCMPMLMVSVLRPEPTLRSGAVGTSYHLNESVSKLCLLIASATMSHHPGFPREFYVTLVDFPHLLHCKSVHIDPSVTIRIQHRVFHLCIEVLALRGWLAIWTSFQTSPQNAITNFWRESQADVSEWSKLTHPLLDIICCCWNCCWRKQWHKRSLSTLIL